MTIKRIVQRISLPKPRGHSDPKLEWMPCREATFKTLLTILNQHAPHPKLCVAQIRAEHVVVATPARQRHKAPGGDGGPAQRISPAQQVLAPPLLHHALCTLGQGGGALLLAQELAVADGGLEDQAHQGRRAVLSTGIQARVAHGVLAPRGVTQDGDALRRGSRFPADQRKQGDNSIMIDMV